MIYGGDFVVFLARNDVMTARMRTPMTVETVLHAPSDAELAAAVEGNLHALFRAMATLPDSKIVERDDLCYHLAAPTNPMFKGVWRTRLDPDDADATIDETIAWFKERDAPFF